MCCGSAQTDLQPPVARYRKHLRPHSIATQRFNLTAIAPRPAKLAINHPYPFVVIVVPANQLKCIPEEKLHEPGKWKHHPRPDCRRRTCQQKCCASDETEPKPAARRSQRPIWPHREKKRCAINSFMRYHHYRSHPERTGFNGGQRNSANFIAARLSVARKPFRKPSPHRAQRRRLSHAVPKSVVVAARHRGGGFASAVLTICGSRLLGQSARAGYRVARLGPCAKIDQLAARTTERTRRIVGPIFHRGAALRTAYKRRSHKLQ